MLTTANRPCKEDRAKDKSPDAGASQMGSEKMVEWHGTTSNEERPETAKEIFGENIGPVSVNYAAVKVLV